MTAACLERDHSVSWPFLVSSGSFFEPVSGATAFAVLIRLIYRSQVMELWPSVSVVCDECRVIWDNAHLFLFCRSRLLLWDRCREALIMRLVLDAGRILIWIRRSERLFGSLLLIKRRHDLCLGVKVNGLYVWYVRRRLNQARLIGGAGLALEHGIS